VRKVPASDSIAKLQIFLNNCHLLMTLMIGLHHFFLEMLKKCWPRFRGRNSTYDNELEKT
jgi:hypothetical protein